MLNRTLTPLAVAFALTVTQAAAPAEAKDHTVRNIILGLSAAIAATSLVALATQAKTDKEYDGYERRYGARLSFRDRAIARCVRAAHRSNLRRGGDGVEYVGLRKARRKSYGLKLYISLRSYERWGPARRTIKCKVRRNGRIKSLAWLN